MSILQFIDASNQCRSREELIEIFEETIQGFGIDRFVYSLARASYATKGKTLHGLLRSYPEDWMKHYVINNYIDDDPTYRYALTHKGPFTWNMLKKNIPLSKNEKRVMDEAEEAGLNNGITLSLHGPFGEVVGFGFASRMPNEELSRNQLSELYAIGNQFHLTYSSFEEPVTYPLIKLSDKQREVLQWSATGKSRSVTAEIMGISENTVDDHFKQIFKKLGCNDKIQAVLMAIQLGLVRV